MELEETAPQSRETSSMRRGPCSAKKREKLQLAMGPFTPGWSWPSWWRDGPLASWMPCFDGDMGASWVSGFLGEHQIAVAWKKKQKLQAKGLDVIVQEGMRGRCPRAWKLTRIKGGPLACRLCKGLGRGEQIGMNTESRWEVTSVVKQKSRKGEGTSGAV